MPRMNRHRFSPIFVVLILAVLLGLEGCGFHLRGKDDIPEGMSRIFVTGARSSDLVRSFSQQLSYYDGQVVPDPRLAQIIVTVIDEDMERRELSISSSGKTNEYELIYNLMYDLKTVNGETILPLQDLELRRDYYNPQIDVVGKEEEERMLRQELYEEAVRSIIRRAHVVLKNNPVEIPPVVDVLPPATPAVPAVPPAQQAIEPDTRATTPGIGISEPIEMPAPVPEATEENLQKRLEILKRFRDQGLISDEVYQERVKKALDENIQ